MPAAKDELTQPELLYQTVENDILKKIVSGELPGGSQIPTETELCKQYKDAPYRISLTKTCSTACEAREHS